MKNIVLIGLPGSGKTTLGKKVAQKTRLNFIDIDEKIEQKIGLSIYEIFTKFGEKKFREIESEAVSEISNIKNTIIATGGGTILNPKNFKILKNNGFFVFIYRNIHEILKTLDVKNRPLFHNDPEKIFEIDEKRREIYKKIADFCLKNDDFNQSIDILAIIAKTLNLSGFFVVGDPISHSISPKIHRTIFSICGINNNYSKFKINKTCIPAFLAAMKKSKIRGINVTIPHKIAVIPYLDRVNEISKICGSVNTIVNRNGKLIGYNTDVFGFYATLKKLKFDACKKNIAIIGSGGAARAAIFVLTKLEAKNIFIVARNLSKSEKICLDMETNATKISIFEFSYDNLTQVSVKCDMIINATPLGMKGFAADFESFEFLKFLRPDAKVVDLIYNPVETNFLKSARKIGLAVQNGRLMLIWQAIFAQKYFGTLE
jgi:shikimate dehydrogenase